MLTSFEAYAKRVNSDMAYMKSNVTALAEDNEDQDGKYDDLKRKYETMEYTTKTMKSDVTELTTKMYNLKTAIFEHNNELVRNNWMICEYVLCTYINYFTISPLLGKFEIKPW